MPKFNTQQARTRAGDSAIVTETRPSGVTYEGAPGYARDAKSELFLLAVANMVSEDTFYESAGDRDNRFEQLVHQVAVEDPSWTAAFLNWLRNDANMRSASLVGALEGARALLKAGLPGGRQLVGSVLQRADEPGEAVAYWLSRYGRKIPMPVKRGIGDAAIRLYNEYSLLKYDTSSHAVRFGDVIELTHPGDRKAGGQRLQATYRKGAVLYERADDWQGDLFKHAIDRRHNRDNPIPESLEMIAAQAELRQLAAEQPGLLADPNNAEALRTAGMTWEDALSAAGPTVDKAKLWEALIPTMGYMALLRNLRNFDQAGISGSAVLYVATRLSDPEQVAKSKQFPFRFLSAHKALNSLTYGPALEAALNMSLANIPTLSGRTLVLVDRSGSMYGPVAGSRSGLNRADAAAVFGAALALRNPGDVDLVEYGTWSSYVPYSRGDSLLRLVNEGFHDMGGTATAAAVKAHYAGHDRVVIVTDEQAHSFDGGTPGERIPAHVPLYTWNLAGYQYGHTAGGANRHTFGGLTDQAFRMIPLLEAGTSTGWPWETHSNS